MAREVIHGTSSRAQNLTFWSTISEQILERGFGHQFWEERNYHNLKGHTEMKSSWITSLILDVSILCDLSKETSQGASGLFPFLPPCPRLDMEQPWSLVGPCRSWQALPCASSSHTVAHGCRTMPHFAARCGTTYVQARRTAPFPPILRPPELCRHMDPRVSPASTFSNSHTKSV